MSVQTLARTDDFSPPTVDNRAALRAQLSANLTGNRTVTMQISPDLAEVMLERNTRNRKVNLPLVRRYARAMAAGQWMLSGQPIIFNTDGVLNDGQHRLEAIKRAGTFILTDVRFGVAPQTFVVTDRGKNRSSADDLGLLGHKYTNITPSVARYVASYRKGQLSHKSRLNYSISPQEVIDIVLSNPGIEQSAAWVMGTDSKLKRTILGATGLAFLHYLLTNIDAETSVKFFDSLIWGNVTAETQPVLLARNICISKQYGTSGKDSTRYLAAAVKAWNHIRRGSKPIRIIVGRDEAFPVAE